ncbi:hypothetical protein K2173_009398 [Erythroxylum novogranatense]|uniref:Glycosyltransferase n=1 Tax=Erythroxylum novogranatense TaxID=1862640 RepID=A0AAV8U3U0_9ROSI|nr:hypothetical protein K2173_009398 [Erythroxylum novogranatense]
MSQNKKLDIAMFPYLAFGHIIPYLELAQFFSQKGHQVTFISTPRNIDRLPIVAPHSIFPIKFVKFTLPSHKHLPSDAEATTDIPLYKHQYLKEAYDGLQGDLASFLENSKPDWIIYDFAPYWLPPIAAKLGVSCAHFSTLNAWTLCFFGPSTNALINGDEEDARTEPEHFIVPPKWIPFETNLAFHLYQAKEIAGGIRFKTSCVSDLYRLGSVISGSDVLAVRSCMELEPEWLQLVGALHQKPVFPVGLLPPSFHNNDDDHYWHTINEWLETKSKSSVVFVALGSEVKLNEEDITELALGLELSKLPFLWALRKQQDEVALPNGFEDRTRGQGLIWTSWASQIRILAHESVGSFLTHCGWNSIIEGLHFGRPLVLLPFYLDQGLNGKVFAEKKVGVEIPRNEEDGRFTRSSVAESLKLVMVDENRHVYLDNAKKMRVVFGDKNLHDAYMYNFVKYLENRTSQKQKKAKSEI